MGFSISDESVKNVACSLVGKRALDCMFVCIKFSLPVSDVNDKKPWREHTANLCKRKNKTKYKMKGTKIQIKQLIA